MKTLPMKLYKLSSVLLIALGLAGHVRAAENIPPTPRTPERIVVGMYPMVINGFDTRADSVKMNFYAWFKKKGNPYKSGEIEIINSPDAMVIGSVDGENAKEGEHFSTLHYQATLDHHWDFKNYPFDHQVFDVIFEASDPIDSTVLLPDTEQSVANANIKLQNWTFLKHDVVSSFVRYNTNFGDTSSFANSYSRVKFSYEYQHDGWRLFFNLFSAFFVCAIFCVLTNLFNDTEIQLQLILTAVIGFIGNKYIVDSIVPEVSYFTLSDAIQVATFSTMLIALTGVVIGIYMKGPVKRVVNIGVAMFSSMGYVGYISYKLYLALV
ncbi:hypothetical protein PTR01_20865 [Serratia bockelmannii]|uniref:hypothetical protein n=1 Tax=Serratia bockelmannii TaxID=2703793 RepID=UPI00313CEFFA